MLENQLLVECTCKTNAFYLEKHTSRSPDAPGAAREAPQSCPGRAPDTSRLHPGLAGGGTSGSSSCIKPVGAGQGGTPNSIGYDRPKQCPFADPENVVFVCRRSGSSPAAPESS